MIATAAALLLIAFMTAMLSLIGAASAVTYTVWIVYGAGLVAWLLVSLRERAVQHRESDTRDVPADSSSAATAVYAGEAGDLDASETGTGMASADAARPARSAQVEEERAGAP